MLGISSVVSLHEQAAALMLGVLIKAIFLVDKEHLAVLGVVDT